MLLNMFKTIFVAAYFVTLCMEIEAFINVEVRHDDQVTECEPLVLSLAVIGLSDDYEGYISLGDMHPILVYSNNTMYSDYQFMSLLNITKEKTLFSKFVNYVLKYQHDVFGVKEFLVLYTCNLNTHTCLSQHYGSQKLFMKCQDTDILTYEPSSHISVNFQKAKQYCLWNGISGLINDVEIYDRWNSICTALDIRNNFKKNEYNITDDHYKVICLMKSIIPLRCTITVPKSDGSLQCADSFQLKHQVYARVETPLTPRMLSNIVCHVHCSYGWSASVRYMAEEVTRTFVGTTFVNDVIVITNASADHGNSEARMKKNVITSVISLLVTFAFVTCSIMLYRKCDRRQFETYWYNMRQQIVYTPSDLTISDVNRL